MKEPPAFSQIICAPSTEKEAFAIHHPTQLWWRLILWIHGKPVMNSLVKAERKDRLTAGFRFYAGLYRTVSVLFLLLAAALSTIHLYVAVGSLLTALYLWGVGGLGYAASDAYRIDAPHGRTGLLAFFVMIIAFLSLFIGVVSSTAQSLSLLLPLTNLLIAAALFVFGVGSYMIEIVFLATDERDS